MTTLLSPLNTRALVTTWLAGLSCPNVKSAIVVTGVTHPNVVEGLRILHIHSTNRGNLILLLHPRVLQHFSRLWERHSKNFVFTLTFISYLLLLVFTKKPTPLLSHTDIIHLKVVIEWESNRDFQEQSHDSKISWKAHVYSCSHWLCSSENQRPCSEFTPENFQKTADIWLCINCSWSYSCAYIGSMWDYTVTQLSDFWALCHKKNQKKKPMRT